MNDGRRRLPEDPVIPVFATTAGIETSVYLLEIHGC